MYVLKTAKMRLLRVFLLVNLVLVSTFFQIASAKETNLIALFGDSITIGENSSFPFALRPMRGFGRLGNDGNFPALPGSDNLDTVLDTENRESIVMNWGRGGSNSGLQPFNGAERISRELQFIKDNYTADNYYILILYGTNDFGSGISESSTRFHTLLMIDRARAKGFTPVIGTLTPRIGGGNISSRNGQIKSAANTRNAPIVDHHQRFLQDGSGGFGLIDIEQFNGVTLRLHPNAEGYEVIARTWFDQYLKDEIAPNLITISPIISILLDD